MSDVLIGVHAYDGEVVGGRDVEKVMNDRLSKAFGFISKSGFDSYRIAISGGEEIHELVKDNFPEDFEKHRFLLAGKKGNTRSEVDFFHRKGLELGVDVCYSVSSKDHVSRIAEYWSMKDRESIDAAIVPSDETYSSSGEEPVVIEASVFKELRDVIDENLHKIDSDNERKIADEIAKVLQKY